MIWDLRVSLPRMIRSHMDYMDYMVHLICIFLGFTSIRYCVACHASESERLAQRASFHTFGVGLAIVTSVTQRQHTSSCAKRRWKRLETD